MGSAVNPPDLSRELERYRAVLVPPCKHMPLATLEKLLALARVGGTVIFAEGLPQDVPGLSDLEARRARHKNLLDEVKLA